VNQFSNCDLSTDSRSSYQDPACAAAREFSEGKNLAIFFLVKEQSYTSTSTHLQYLHRHRFPVGMTGRVNGMYNWRLGWRSSVLDERNGKEFIQPSLEDYLVPLDRQTNECDPKVSPSCWKWWHEICGNPKYILAPMIGQSEMSFRLLCRQVGGVQLCYSPMYLASNILQGQHDDEIIHCQAAPYHDRPLICQLAGNNIEEMIAAGRYVEPYVDAVDVNLGCPQRCADLGNYGSYLPERDLELVIAMLSQLVSSLSVPITAKIRILPGDLSLTVNYALRLQATGISALCIHGRSRLQKEHQGPADWSAIKLLKSLLSIPVIANGSIGNYLEAQTCLEFTKADAVMSGTGLLRNPSLFISPERCYLSSSSSSSAFTALSWAQLAVDPQYLLHILSMCQRYLQLVSSLSSFSGAVAVNTKDQVTVVRDHLFAMLQVLLMDTKDHDLWSLLSSQSVRSVRQFEAILDAIYYRHAHAHGEGHGEGHGHGVEGDSTSGRTSPIYELLGEDGRERPLYSLREIKKAAWCCDRDENSC
jgi:tRNA-dihydrouridine synthase